MSRLPNLPPSATRTPTTTDGRGFRIWETRRSNAFFRNLNLLRSPAALADDQLRLVAHEASEYLVSQLPASADSLPRGYAVGRNSAGERTLCHGGFALNPGFTERVAERAEIERFAGDLKTGLLAEIEAFLKARAQ